MKNLKKLKAAVAHELKQREVYKEAFDMIKDIENLEKHRKQLIADIKEHENVALRHGELALKAVSDRETLEAEYAEKAKELEEDLAMKLKDHEDAIENRTDAEKAEVKKLTNRRDALTKQIKAKTKQAEEAEARVTDAEKKLEEIRGQLKSI